MKMPGTKCWSHDPDHALLVPLEEHHALERGPLHDQGDWARGRAQHVHHLLPFQVLLFVEGHEAIIGSDSPVLVIFAACPNFLIPL